MTKPTLSMQASAIRRRRSKLPMAVTFAVVALVIVGAAFSGYQLYRRRIVEATLATLGATARLQAELVSRNLLERQRDGRVLALRRSVWYTLDPGVPSALRASERAQLAVAIEQTRHQYDYEQILVFDSAGQLVVGSPGGHGLDDADRQALSRVLAERREGLTPLHRGEAGSAEFGIIVPVFAAGDSTRRTLGAVFMDHDAGDALLELLGQFDHTFPGEESVIAQASGDSLFVFGSRVVKGIRTPRLRAFGVADNRHVPSRLWRAIRAGEHAPTTQALDYNDAPAFATARRVLRADMMMIVKVPVAEVEADLADVALLVAGATLLLLTVVWLLLRNAWLLTDRRAATEHFSVATRYLAATSSSIDGFVLWSRTGQLLDANRALEHMTGYSRVELLQMSLPDLRVDMAPEMVPEWIATLSRKESTRFHSKWRRRDGSDLEIDVSASFLGEEQDGQIFCFVRDVTEQIQTNSRLNRLNTLYKFLNNASEALFAARTIEDAYQAICHTAVEHGHFPLAWVAVANEANGQVRPVAQAGSASLFAEIARLAGDPAGHSGRLPTAVALHEARPVIVNDFVNDPLTRPWHALAAQHRLGASASLPVVVDGKAVAVVVFYAETAGYFSDELAALLAQVTRLLAIVAQSLASDEQRRAEEERRRVSEERFRLLFDASPMAMYVQDRATGQILRVNRAFTELFGYTLADIPDADVQMERFYADPDYREELKAIFRRDYGDATDEGLRAPSLDIRARCKDGTHRTAQSFVSRTSGEYIIGWLDVTELRANQALLQDAEQIARLGSFAFDYGTRIERRSPDFLRVLGFDEALLDGFGPVEAPLLNLIHADDRERIRAMQLRAVDVDEVVRAVPTDDKQRYLRIRVRVVHDAAGVPVTAAGSYQDVTEEVAASRELERLRDHLQELVDERTADLAQANATLQMTDRRLKAMLAMSQQAATLDERAILQLGIDEAARLTGSPVGYLHLISDDQSIIEFGGWATGTLDRCHTEHAQHYPVLEAGIWADAVRLRTPAVHNEFTVAMARPDYPAGHVVLARHLVVPVVEGERVRLLIGVGNKEAPYDESDVQELQLIGHDIWSIVERRRADLALEQAFQRVRASDERFAFAMEASAEGIWDFDVRTGSFAYSNEYWHMLGYEPGEFPGTFAHWLSLVHPDDRGYAAARVTERLRTGAATELEFRMRLKDGGYRWFLNKGKVVEFDNGRAVRVVGTQSDLSARREAEDELRAAVELADAANRAKSAFLAVMSHEIRTPLNGVISMAEILAQSPLPPAEMDAVQTIQSSANNLLSVIDDILDFSKIEAGRLDVDLAEVSLLHLVEQLGDSLVPMAKARDVELQIFLAPELPGLVRCDPTRVRQILYNLAGNAIKFSEGVAGRSGRVSLRVEMEHEAPLRLSFTIADNGIGMAPQTVDGLFTSFSQAEVSTTRRFGGTGLGLAISKRLVELMQGTIAVESQLGEGSTFRVVLPMDPVDGSPVRPAHDLEGIACIIVERDGRFPARDMQRVFESAGATVQVVPDAAAAAATARRLSDLCVVLLDLQTDRAILDPELAVLPNVRHVVLTRGRRHGPRIQQPNVVTLDCDFMRARRLTRAVAVAAGRASPEVSLGRDGAPERLERVARITVAEARAQGRLILVAEDDTINKKVILQQLALLGYAAEVADDGIEALRMWREGRYAMLLTDLHMPEMDGYTLSLSIRAEEKVGERLPIVALTANALRGESVRATAVGMDGYLTKPVPLQTLREVVESHLRAAAGPSTAPGLAPGAGVSRAIGTAAGDRTTMVHVSVLQQLVGTDPAVIRDFLADFQQSARRLAADLLRSHDEGNFPQVSAVAHKLKSSSRSVGALRLGDLCGEIENAGKAGSVTDLATHRETFVKMVALVDDELTVMLTQS